MTRRRREETVDIFGGKLSGIVTLGGAEQGQPASKAGQYFRKTYLLTEELIARVKRVADRHKVGHSELVRWALQTILDEVENGGREIPVTVEEKRVITTG
jgi:hypothetical protein